jgi:hypothetical protein
VDQVVQGVLEALGLNASPTKSLTLYLGVERRGRFVWGTYMETLSLGGEAP